MPSKWGWKIEFHLIFVANLEAAGNDPEDEDNGDLDFGHAQFSGWKDAAGDWPLGAMESMHAVHLTNFRTRICMTHKLKGKPA